MREAAKLIVSSKKRRIPFINYNNNDNNDHKSEDDSVKFKAEIDTADKSDLSQS
jgi:hypothetical protein